MHHNELHVKVSYGAVITAIGLTPQYWEQRLQHYNSGYRNTKSYCFFTDLTRVFVNFHLGEDGSGFLKKNEALQKDREKKAGQIIKQYLGYSSRNSFTLGALAAFLRLFLRVSISVWPSSFFNGLSLCRW